MSPEHHPCGIVGDPEVHTHKVKFFTAEPGIPWVFPLGFLLAPDIAPGRLGGPYG